jgi:large subunit ribosomal protein L21
MKPDINMSFFLTNRVNRIDIRLFKSLGFFAEVMNMYAVVATGGKQYKVEEGEVLRFEKLTGEIGDEVTFDQVLMVSDGEDVRIGQPVVEGATVKGSIVEQGKNKKIIVFKYKRRKRYRRKQGHRQPFTAVKISAIEA